MSPSEPSEPLETALDELYGVEASEFVATRKRLAAELRRAGETGAAKELLTARRPTTTAWALNQLRRTEPALVEAFLERSRDLEAAQTGELEGGRDALREAMREQRSALAAVTDAAMAALGTRANESYRGQILATLHAASADPEVGEQLAQGRFIRELTGATGFLDAPGLTLVPDLEPRPPRAARKPPEPAAKADMKTDKRAERAAAAKARADAEAQRRAERERAAAEAFARQVADAEQAAQDAEDTARAAEAEAAAAGERVEQLERDLDDARRAVRTTSERAASARRESARQARAATKLRSRGPRIGS